MDSKELLERKELLEIQEIRDKMGSQVVLEQREQQD